MTTRKTTNTEPVDFDFDADRTRTTRKSIRFDGHTYTIPGKLPLTVAHDLNKGELITAAEKLFGKKDAAVFLESDQADVEALVNIITKVYEVPTGESAASPS